MYPFGTDEIVDNDDEDIDPFAELEIGTRSTTNSAGNDPLAVFETDDPLEALTDVQESVTEEIVISFEEDSVPELIGDNSEPKNGLWRLALLRRAGAGAQPGGPAGRASSAGHHGRSRRRTAAGRGGGPGRVALAADGASRRHGWFPGQAGRPCDAPAGSGGEERPSCR